MTRDEIRELAAFQADESKGACALSFYFQPDPPQDRSHRSEAIVAKDVVKQALKSAAAQGKNGPLHADLDRVLDLRPICAAVAGKGSVCLLRAEFLEGIRTATASWSDANLSAAAVSVEAAGRFAGRPARAVRRHGRPAAGAFFRPAPGRSARGMSIVHLLSRSGCELRLQRI